jgi:pyrroloquinoline quinone (PQQ) biosynthesis protein C
MKANEWQDAFGKLAYDFVQTPAFVAYHSVQLTPPRARLLIQQRGISIRNRRDCWAALFSHCPELSVRQKIMEHEYEEMVEDEYSKHGHLDLVVQQAASVGLSADEVLNAEPLPITRAVNYAYLWYIRNHTWQEGLAGMIANEVKNASSAVLAPVGGGGSERDAKNWMKDLGLTEKDVPNSIVHSKADDKHGKMFLPFLEQYVAVGEEVKVLQAAKESLELRAVWYEGITRTMEKIN